MSGDLTVANASNSIEVGVWSTVTTEECTWQPGSGSSTPSALASCPRGSANGIASSDAASAQRSGWFSRLTSWQEKWMARKAEQVLAVSSPIALNAAGLGAAKVKAVHNEVSAIFSGCKSPPIIRASRPSSESLLRTSSSLVRCRIFGLPAIINEPKRGSCCMKNHGTVPWSYRR